MMHLFFEFIKRIFRNLLSILLATALFYCGQTTIETSYYPSGKKKTEKIFSQSEKPSTKTWIELKEYHYNGNLKLNVSIQEKKFHGPSTSWWLSGKIKSKGAYRKAKKSGKWHYYFEDSGNLFEEGEYVEDKKHGEWKTWWPNERKQSIGFYQMGERIGMWRQWDSLGSLLSENNCFPKNEEGYHKAYYGHGPLREYYTCTHGKKTGVYERYHENRTLAEQGRYNAAGKKEGMWRSWIAQGKLASECAYQSGLQIDTCRQWDDKGRLTSLAVFKKGSGVEKQFNDSGAVTALVHFENGLKEGEHVTFYSNGEVNTKTMYKKGLAVSFQRWHRSDRSKPILAIEGKLKEGKRHGIWKRYSEKGVLIETVPHENGEAHGKAQYFNPESGKLQREQTYQRGMAKKSRIISGP